MTLLVCVLIENIRPSKFCDILVFVSFVMFPNLFSKDSELGVCSSPLTLLTLLISSSSITSVDVGR